MSVKGDAKSETARVRKRRGVWERWGQVRGAGWGEGGGGA